MRKEMKTLIQGIWGKVTSRPDAREMNAWVEEGSYADKYCKANFINRLRPDGSKPEDEDD